MKFIVTPLFILSLLVATVTVFSCKKSKPCAATNVSDFPTTIYLPNQQVRFKDSLNNEISFVMSSEYKNTDSYDLLLYKPKGGSTGEEHCAAEIQLESINGYSTDTAFNPRFAFLRCAI
jgi:hypothetical protein